MTAEDDIGDNTAAVPGAASTTLARDLAREIAASGPIGIDRFMARCLIDPDDGYYTTHAGIGRDGDFLTAPEVSQIFGEIIGLWAAVVWQRMGAPGRVALVELGPGRGTLLADALRAIAKVSSFRASLEVHLVEINPAFRDLQAERLRDAGHRVRWHETLPLRLDCPAIVIANEFLDTIPGRQWVLDDAGAWAERRVGLDAEGSLVFVECPAPPPLLPFLPGAPAHRPAVFTAADMAPLGRDLAALTGGPPLAALFIDYGHTRSDWGDTLQAVRDHRAEHPLACPGQADLSLAVDFAAAAAAFAASGFATDGPVSQTEFLGTLGLAERASRLMAANSARANEIETAALRLIAPAGMGGRFKCLGVRSPALPHLPGLA
jgi:SAM-dependent MidA family methyltransferase